MRPAYRTELSPVRVQMVRERIGGCSEHPAGRVVPVSSLPAQRAGGRRGGGVGYRKCHGMHRVCTTARITGGKHGT